MMRLLKIRMILLLIAGAHEGTRAELPLQLRHVAKEEQDRRDHPSRNTSSEVRSESMTYDCCNSEAVRCQRERLVL